MRLTLAHCLSATEPLSSRGPLGEGGDAPKSQHSFLFSSSEAHPVYLVSWTARGRGGKAEKGQFFFLLFSSEASSSHTSSYLVGCLGGGGRKSRFYFYFRISEARPWALS